MCASSRKPVRCPHRNLDTEIHRGESHQMGESGFLNDDLEHSPPVICVGFDL